MVMPCTCKYPQQDALHGPGHRVYNPTKNGDRAHCTVCGAEKGTGVAPKTGKK
jgi:hypothetical protein